MFSVKGKALFSEGGWGEAWIHMFSVKGGYTCSQLRGKPCSQRGGGGGGGPGYTCSQLRGMSLHLAIDGRLVVHLNNSQIWW